MWNDGPILSFGLPEGHLELRADDLARWAEHLTWSYRLMDVKPGSTIGVVDYGTSPTAFLGSRLLTPMLDAGVAERLPGRIICLDASRERVALVPSILSQVKFDVLVVREEVVPALVTYCREANQRLDDLLIVTTFGAVSRDAQKTGSFRKHRRMLLLEDSMLLASECHLCGRLHLRQSLYAHDESGDRVTVRASGKVVTLPPSVGPAEKGCPDGSEDWLFPVHAAGSQPWTN